MNIPTSLVTKMRALNEDMMPDGATVYQRTLADDGESGKQETWTTVRATTNCRLIFVGNNPAYQRRIEAAQIKASEAYVVSFPVGTGVAATDRFATNANTYAIVSDAGPRSFQMAEKFLCRKL